jgi:hypothetical protein
MNRHTPADRQACPRSVRRSRPVLIAPLCLIRQFRARLYSRGPWRIAALIAKSRERYARETKSRHAVKRDG